MFSDTIFDSLADIKLDLRRGSAFKGIYPPEIVIEMMTSMHLLIWLSDLLMPDDTLAGGETIESLRDKAKAKATAAYNENWRQKE
jgi:hypothetical protein